MAHRLSHIIPIFGPYMAHTTQFGKGELVTDNDLHINLKIITLYIKTKTSYIESIIYKPVTPSILCNFYNMDTSVKRTLVSVPLMAVLKTLDYNASSVFMMFFCFVVTVTSGT